MRLSLRFVGPRLKLADDRDFLSLAEILRADVCQASPCVDAEEIRLLFLRESSVHRDGESADLRAGLRSPQFGVFRQIADKSDFIRGVLLFDRSVFSRPIRDIVP